MCHVRCMGSCGTGCWWCTVAPRVPASMRLLSHCSRGHCQRGGSPGRREVRRLQSQPPAQTPDPGAGGSGGHSAGPSDGKPSAQPPRPGQLQAVPSPKTTGPAGTNAPGARCCRSTAAATPGCRSGGPGWYCCRQRWQGSSIATASPWPATATVAVASSSMASPGTSPNRWAQPSSPRPRGGRALNVKRRGPPRGPWLPLPNRPRWSGWEVVWRSAARGLCRGDGFGFRPVAGKADGQGEEDGYRCLAPGPGVK